MLFVPAGTVIVSPSSVIPIAWRPSLKRYVRSFGTYPVEVVVLVIFTVPPADPVMLAGDSVKFGDTDVSAVVNKTALAKGETEKIFHT